MSTLTSGGSEITDVAGVHVTPEKNLRVRLPGRVFVCGVLIACVILLCAATLPWTLSGDTSISYLKQNAELVRAAPSFSTGGLFGYDALGRSIIGRTLLGGCISLLIGFAAAAIAVVLGTCVGLFAGYTGGWVDAVLMRGVDILYGLPYILLVILFKIALEPPLADLFNSSQLANLCVLFLAIGLVSWLTMARVVRGQVLVLREMPFVEAARALGLPRWRIFVKHVLPNLVGPIIVYATLTIPAAILQESFLSFLGVGVKLPLPTWGSLASEGVAALSPVKSYWWTLVFPCGALMLALLCLNFLGDGLRDWLDPKKDSAKL
jgi:oligopeptide transport system permease protein